MATDSANIVARGVHRRAVEAVVWGMPAVNFDLLYQSMVRAGGAWNQVVYWSRLPDWKNQTLTPNPDVLYFFPFINTKDAGPVVLEIPPAGGDGSITGSVDDAWQTAIEDVGPAGVDKGKGGRYLILPPGFKDKVPDGYIPMPSSTYQSYGILRSNPASGNAADVAKAVSYGKQVKVYPLSSSAKPPPTVFVDAIDIVYDNIIPYDLRFFQSLDRMIQIEPWLDRDRAMIDPLKSIGIEKGKPFNPGESAKAILGAAASDAHDYLAARYEEVFQPPFDASARWALPASKELAAALMSNFADSSSYPTDARGLAYSYAYFSAKHLGEGQYYLMTIKDKAGDDLDGTQVLSPPCAAEPSSQAVLVCHGLRPGHARADSRQEVVQPFVQHAGPATECRRFERRVFLAERASRQGIQLDSNQCRRRIRGVVSPLRSREGVLRKEMAAAGHREDRERVDTPEAQIWSTGGSVPRG